MDFRGVSKVNFFPTLSYRCILYIAVMVFPYFLYAPFLQSQPVLCLRNLVIHPFLLDLVYPHSSSQGIAQEYNTMVGKGNAEIKGRANAIGGIATSSMSAKFTHAVCDAWVAMSVPPTSASSNSTVLSLMAKLSAYQVPGRFRDSSCVLCVSLP